MEITKIVGAICGSLLVFLLLNFFAGEIFDTHSEEVAYLIDVPEAAGEGGGEAAPTEDVAALVAAADATKGEGVFKKCAACHKVDGSNAVGPHLENVVNRPVGSVADFAYSDSMKGHGGDWTPENLYHFLLKPSAFVPGTKMSFAGLPKADDRANVIAYLETLEK
jgi:cytochrome c